MSSDAPFTYETCGNFKFQCGQKLGFFSNKKILNRLFLSVECGHDHQTIFLWPKYKGFCGKYMVLLKSAGQIFWQALPLPEIFSGDPSASVDTYILLNTSCFWSWILYSRIGYFNSTRIFTLLLCSYFRQVSQASRSQKWVCHVVLVIFLDFMNDLMPNIFFREKLSLLLLKNLY